MQQLTLHIFGQVQGVFFRDFVRAEARKRGLTGWVKNNPDGSVTVLAEGQESALQELKRNCEHGTHGATVERVEEAWQDVPAATMGSFEIE